MVFPVIKAYHGYMLPLNLALTYLWLTSLIFSSQDYSGRRCRYFSPPLVNRCGLKHTVQAFFIIGLCGTPPRSCHSGANKVTSSVFLLFNTILEALMWASHRRSRTVGAGDIEKDRPLTTTTGTTAGGADGERAAQAAV